MRTGLFWLLSFGGFAAVSLLCGILVWPQLVAAWPSIEEKIDRFRRLPPFAKLVLLLFVGVFVVYGSTKTNQVDESESEVVGVQSNLQTCAFGLMSGTNILCTTTTSDYDYPPTSVYDYPPPTVTPEDIARGWQLWEVRTNCNVSYTMPEGATLATNWWVRGAYEDVKPFDFGSWRFPFGTNEYDSAWAFSWGKLRFALGDTNTEIVAVGAPMSAVPYRSRLWSAADTNGARVVTWEDFALNRDINTPVNAQIELRANGDFITRSNEVETVYRYIDPFDNDGDGILDDQDWDPRWWDGDYTGQSEEWVEYVDELVGTGLENGYYKLTATFPSGYFRRTVLSVGDEKIVVAKPGEYVFLLEKGNEYEIELEPFVEGVEFEAVDDIPGAAPMLLAGLNPSWSGGWTVDEGWYVIDPPGTNFDGRVLWMPKLRVVPGTWSPTDDSPSETFTAELYDQTGNMDEPSYQWMSFHESLDVNLPNSDSTEMTWRGNGQVAGCVARLEVYIAGGQLETALTFGFNDPDDPHDDYEDSELSVGFSMNVPEALLVNSNEVMSSKIGDIRMNLRGTIPSNGSLVLRPSIGSECVRLTGQSAWRVTPASVSAGMEIRTHIEGVQASTSLRDVELEAVLVFPDKERVCGRARLTVIEVGGIIFFDEPDGRPVVAPDSWVPFGLAIFPAAATSLVWTEYDVRHMNEAGEFSGWQWVGYGDTYTTECGFSPTSRGIWQVRGTVHLEPEGCPHGTDERDTLFGSDEPAYVYVPREPRLVFDYDRDGQIGTNDIAKAKSGNVTFRFWVNDDNDSGDVCAATDYCSDTPGQTTKNCQDGQVNGRRDLLDFTPVWMDFSDVFPTGTPAQVWNKIEWRISSGCVNAVWSNLGRENAGSFQRQQDLYEFGPQLYDLPECADITDINEGAVIPDSLRGTSETEGGVFLIEGRALGFDLAIEGWRANRSQNEQEWLVTSEADICITEVEQMYRFASLRGAAENPTLTVNVPSTPLNQSDDTKDLDVFFTHGFRVSEPDAHAWGAEVFKRLWQSGSNANFHMLTWRGDYGMIDSGLYYQHNAWFAQRTGGAHKRYIEAAQSVVTNRILMTQSLGNMVACEALREGLQVGQYYMFDAAIPSETIDASLRAETLDDESFAKYVPYVWQDYTNACWAANWHRFFEDDPTDARGKMGWPNRFQDALANAAEVFNYYSSGDSVFTEEEEAPSLSDGVVHWGLEWYLGIVPCPTVNFTLDNHSWQKQEVMKGAAKVGGTLSGGWGFNIWEVHDEDSDELWSTHYTPQGVSAALADGSITNRPVFNVSDATELMNSSATEDDIFLALAKHVPALSSPVGGSAVLRNNEDHDLNTSAYRNGWGRNHPTFNDAWLHSDMKDMAFFYVYKLYEQLAQKGALK